MTIRTASLAAFIAVVATTPAAAVKASYSCAGGTRLTADFSQPGAGPGKVNLVFSGAGGKVTLPQQMSADGGRYASDTMEFWIKGREATLTRNGKSVTCKTT